MTNDMVASLAPGEIRTHVAGCVKLTIMTVGTGQIQITKRVNGDLAGCWTETFETGALARWADLVRVHQASEQTTTVTLGGVEVSITFSTVAGQPHTYVETVAGGGVVAEWTAAYSSRRAAVAAWRRACDAFRAWGTADAIAAERKRLTFVNLRALNSRTTTRAQLAALTAQIEAVTDFDTDIALAALVAA